MKKLVISVKRWLRGGKAESVLRNESGSMCCLGFLARDCGASVNNILNKSTPMVTADINWPKGILTNDSFGGYDSTITNQIVTVNDHESLPLKQKQSELKQLFLKIGYRLTFK